MSNKDKKPGFSKIGDMWNIKDGKNTFTKQASAVTGGGSSMMSSSLFYTPELTPESWLLPKSRQEILKWCRIFFNLEPYIQSILNMHARYPFSRFKLTCEDTEVREFFEQAMDNENFNLYDFLLRASLSYQVYGEAIPFGNWNEKKKYWDNFVLLEPELVEIQHGLFDTAAKYELIVTDELRKLTNDPKFKEESEKLPEVVRTAILSQKNVPLDPASVSVIARLTSPSAVRGTPIMQSVFKILIYQDYIRLAQLRIAERHQMPFELWTLGNLEKNILPTQEDLEAFRAKINEATQNPPYVMVYPPIVDYKALGVKDKLLNIYEDLGYVENQILVAMGVNKNLILGEGPSFSNVKTMSLHRLIMDYQTVRDMFERWVYNKVFRRISEANKFYSYKGKIKRLIIPKIEWERSLNIEDEESEKKMMLDMHGKGFVSTKTLYSKFPNIDFEVEKKNLEDEKGTIFDKTDGKRIPKEFKPKEGSPAPGGMGGMKMPPPDLGGGGEGTPPIGGENPLAPAPGAEAGGLGDLLEKSIGSEPVGE
jgi:hypothetical protein